MLFIHHITGIKSDSLWVGGHSNTGKQILKQVDSSGNVMKTINDAFCEYGSFAITQNGELLYLELGNTKVQKKTHTEQLLSLPHRVKILNAYSVHKSQEIFWWVYILPEVVPVN